MRATLIVTPLFAIVTMLLPALAAAQDWDQPWSDPRDRPPRVDLSVSGGMVAPSDWSDLVLLGTLSPTSGVFEQVLVRDVRVEPDSVFGAAVTYWRDRVGFRVQGGLSKSSATIGGTSLDAAEPGRDVLSSDVKTWFYDVRGAIGLVRYSPDRKLWPYVFLGFGGITYDLGRTITPPLLTFVDRGRAGGAPDLVIVDDNGKAFLAAVDELGVETVPALNFGAGTDFRLPFGGGALGIRIEVADHVSSSPLRLRIRELDAFGGLTNDDAVRFGAVHHLRAEAGLVLQIGR